MVSPLIPEPGDYFLIKGKRDVFKCLGLHPPGICVKAHEMEGPKGRRTVRMTRILKIEDIDRILKGNEV